VTNDRSITSVSLGLPILFNEKIIQCELPAELEYDGYMESDSQPASEGEPMPSSIALGLFRIGRIISKISNEANSTPAESSEFTLSKIETWEHELQDSSTVVSPQHLVRPLQEKAGNNPVVDRGAVLVRGID
jgi:hypothetical protein